MTTIAFPSLEWLELLQARMNGQPEKYGRFGTADCRFVLRIDPDEDGAAGDVIRYGVVFEEYTCPEVTEVEDEADFDPDFVLSGPRAAWTEMVVNIAAHGKADRSHTINRLTLIKKPLRVERTNDQVRMEKFFQFNYTIQAFLDEGGAVDGVNLEEPALGGV
ncbi:MAG: hypothetical protein LC792_28430 [Actinobacteria bacterium]|nr:hypothetical protein [Actinomycetota bacterium]